MEKQSNLLDAIGNIPVGENLAVAVTFVGDDGMQPDFVIGRVFGATGTEMYRVHRPIAGGSYRNTMLEVLLEIYHQWETNRSL